MKPSASSYRARQQGVVMVVTLIALVVLLVGAVALVRSSDSASTLAGQLGFRRDMKNQAERALSTAILALKSGDLVNAASREAALTKANYSAKNLEVNANGLPKILLQSADTFTSAGYVINVDDSASDSEANANSGVRAWYIIERLCMAEGKVDASTCVMTNVMQDLNGQDTNSQTRDGGFRAQNLTVYRVSVRVDGPRGTQAFYQSILAL